MPGIDPSAIMSVGVTCQPLDNAIDLFSQGIVRGLQILDLREVGLARPGRVQERRPSGRPRDTLTRVKRAPPCHAWQESVAATSMRNHPTAVGSEVNKGVHCVSPSGAVLALLLRAD